MNLMDRVGRALRIRIPPLVIIERNFTPGNESVTIGSAPNQELAAVEYGCGAPAPRPIFAKDGAATFDQDP